MSNTAGQLQRRIDALRSEVSGGGPKGPYDLFPPGFRRDASCDWSAWHLVLPNFPFAGQMFSKARFAPIHRVDGFFISRVGVPRTAPDAERFVVPPFPPESETADAVVWDGKLLADWHRWRRKFAAQTGEFWALDRRWM